METLIARQPIFNVHRRLFAYELLYRGTNSLSLDNMGGDRATSRLLTSSFLTEGLEEISGNKPCFINFTEELITKNIAENFPKNKIVIEILEDVEPSAAVIAACKRLKQKGYTLALDDFVYAKKFLPLLELADIIKFDLLITPLNTLHPILYKLRGFNLKYLAEKIETYKEVGIAVKMGFSYFQGYFFARPETVRIQELASSKINLIQLLAEVNQKSLSTQRLTEIVATDVALSYKLLRWINSAYFYTITEITSITHAIAYLGEKEVRKFVTLVIISEMATDKPDELIKLATSRAKFCELLSRASTRKTDPNEIFMLGLFSLLPAMLDTPMVQILTRISLSPALHNALLGNKSPLSNYLLAVTTYEQQDMQRCLAALMAIGVKQEKIYNIYLSSLKFADSLVG